tara:strand:+ start:3506 stop:3961 length:456 start_codon:yes stop_codon:yes gene_type:complete
MKITFREIDPFNCWIWIEFFEAPNKGEKSYIDGIFDSWYVIGKLGGFNAENLQAHNEGGELSWLNYDEEEANSVLPALMHNLGQMEYQGKWARCWVDFGTSDSISLDILINLIYQMNKDLIQISKVLIGGVNDDWPIDDQPDAVFPLREIR